MNSAPDTTILLIATGIADFIVGFGCLGLCALLVWAIRRRVNTLLEGLAADAVEEPAPPISYLIYMLALFFWPAGLGFGLYFLTKPETARAGGVCMYMLLIYVTFSVVLAIGIVTAGVVLMPQLFVL